MNKQGSYLRNSSTVYDAGGWFLIAMFFGVAFLGVVLDYFWNYFVLSMALRWRRISFTYKRKTVYCVIITACGLLIDWLYYEFTWGTLVIGGLKVSAAFPVPGTHPLLELSTILIPMALIATVNYFISRLHLHLAIRDALVVGGIIGVITAPWLIVAFVLLNW